MLETAFRRSIKNKKPLVVYGSDNVDKMAMVLDYGKKEGYIIKHLEASKLTETDILGVPYAYEKEGVVYRKRPDYLMDIINDYAFGKKTMLVVTEIELASSSVIRAIDEIMMDMVGVGYIIPKECFMVLVEITSEKKSVLSERDVEVIRVFKNVKRIDKASPEWHV